ncbi:MAG: hypothetical protein HY675_11705 [Chloroflexi bacterium]|nr:hypothetical protein [Chloroflexota bacterium]
MVVLLASVIPFWGMMQDDTYIHLRFARNLLNGYGMSFNPGELTYGDTSPLWVALLAALGFLGADLEAAAKTLSLFFGLVSVAIFHLVARGLLGPGVLSFAATLAWAVNPTLVRWAASGMESTLAAAALLLCALVLTRLDVGRGELLQPLSIGVSTLIRPEFTGLFLLWLAGKLLFSSTGLRASLVSTLKSCLLYTVPLVPWWCYAFVSFGTVVPNTALAKGAYSPMLADALAPLAKVSVFAAGSVPVELAVLVLGTGWLWRSGGLRKYFDRRLLLLHFALVAWIVGVPAGYILKNAHVTDRYMLVIFPLLTLYAFAVLGTVLFQMCKAAPSFARDPQSEDCGYGYGRVQVIRAVWGQLCNAASHDAPRFQRRAKPILFAILAVTLAQSLVTSFVVEHPYVEGRRVHNESLKEIGVWLAENTPPTTTVAIFDAGIVGYFSDRRVLDVVGLVNPAIIPFRAAGRESEYLNVARPDYLVVGGRVADIPKSSSNWSSKATVVLSKEYEMFGYGLSEASMKLVVKPEALFLSVYRLNW